MPIASRFYIIILLLSVGSTASQCAASNSQQAAIPTMYVYYSNSGDEENNFVRLLLDNFKLNKPSLEIKLIDVNLLTKIVLDQQLAQSNRCVLTVGHTSLSKVLATRTKKPIFSTYVSKFNLDNYIAKYQQFGVTLSGIYEEQSFDRQLLLAKAINSELKIAAIVFGQKTKFFIADYRSASIKRGFELSFTILQRNGSANHFVTGLASADKFLVIINDGHHYSPKKLPSLLMASHNRNVPIIGNRRRDFELAAMASVFTPNKNLAIEVALEATNYCESALSSIKGVRKPDFSRHFTIAVNQPIAVGLNYPGLVEQELLKAVLAAEQTEKENIEL